MLALANTTVASGVLTTGSDALILFQGPDGYDDPIYASASSTGPRVQVQGPLQLATKAFVTAAIAAGVSGVAPTDSGVAALVNNSGSTTRAAVTSIATTAATNAANAVVGAAPTALNTLKELADALGDDANYAAAVANSIAAKGPSVGSTAWLTTWGAAIDSLVIGAITRDGNGAATGGGVVWPDGTTGTYTGAASTAFPGAVDSYTVTYAPTGGTTKTVTQPTLTRGASGAVVTRPALTVA